jgi:DNA invertase Pin-like site-specific DNA recombinase
VTTAYSYIRFSSSDQTKGDSLRRQTELSEKYAHQHNLTLDQTLHLQDLGVSAFNRSNIEKGALGAFLEAVKTGRIAAGSYLLVESLDRLSRDQVLAALEIFISIIRHGITIVTLSDGMVYEEKTIEQNFSPLMYSIMIMARAHEESLTKSKRIRSAWLNKIANASEKKLTARCGGWLQLSSDKKTFNFIPDRTEVVKEIIQMSMNGMGQSVIAKRLNDRKIKSWTGGHGWHTSTVSKILNNTALYGDFQPQVSVSGKLKPYGEPIKDYFPALITKDQFTNLKAARSQRLFAGTGRKSTNVPNLISGIGKCGYCGASMVLAGNTKLKHSADGSTTKIESKALVCDNGRRGIRCWAIRWNYKDLETSLLTFCKGLELQKLLDEFDKSAEANNETKKLQEELVITESKIESSNRKVANIIAAIEEGVSSAVLKDRLQLLEEEISAAIERKKELQEKISENLFAAKSDAADIVTMQKQLDRIENMSGDELFVFRSALAETIRKTLREVRLFPAGALSTQAEIDLLREQLQSSGYSPNKIKEYLSSFRTEPARARGRYASVKSCGRHFSIMGKTGGMRVVYPKFENPAEVIVEVNAGGMEHEKTSTNNGIRSAGKRSMRETTATD